MEFKRRSILVKFSFSVAGISTLFFLSNCQVYNSSSGDALLFSDGAKAVLQQKCSQCHNFATLTDEQLISQHLVVAGSPTTSTLFLRIKGSGDSSANMPPSSATNGAVSAVQLETLRTWIQAL